MSEQYIQKLFDLSGKKALITGAGSGIGQAIALSLAKFGAEVTIVGRTLSKLNSTKKLVEQSGGVCNVYPLDIADTQAQVLFFKQYIEKHGTLDIFVANAGINIRSELPDAKVEDILKIVETDYMGSLVGIIQASNIMKTQHSGNIVVITSLNGISPLPNQSIYSSIKAALESIIRSTASSMAKYGVRVNGVAPGCVHSDGNKHIYCHEEYRIAKEAVIPLGFIGNPKDIGDVVASIVGDAFRFMTGTTILVDGGENIRPIQQQPINDNR